MRALIQAARDEADRLTRKKGRKPSSEDRRRAENWRKLADHAEHDFLMCFAIIQAYSAPYVGGGHAEDGFATAVPLEGRNPSAEA